ncbi:MAG: hypothetical protein AAF986_00140 [Pseudomonadota bacterium]
MLNRNRIAAQLGAIALCACAQANAAAVYDIDMLSKLTLDSVTGVDAADVSVTAESTLFSDSLFESGVGAGTHVLTFTPPLGASSDLSLPAVISYDIDGSGAGVGVVDTFVSADSLVSLGNLSTTDTATFNFSLDYKVSVSASATSAGETASAEGFLTVESSTEVDPLVDLALSVFYGGPSTMMMVADKIMFSVIVAPGDDASVFVLADALASLGSITTGSVADPVPLPPAALLFAGPMLLGMRHIRRRQS